MTASVRDAYDAMAELYASLFIDALDRDHDAATWLGRFSTLIPPKSGAVADLGCGPGYVVNHLSELGLSVVGYDLSPGQIAEARKAFPDLRFEVGDLTALDTPDASLHGIVSRHSLIHLHPDTLPSVFHEWNRLLEAGGHALVSFSGVATAEAHGTAFDHKVVTAYALSPAIVAEQMEDAGFSTLEIDIQPPPKDGRPFDRVTLLSQKPFA